MSQQAPLNYAEKVAQLETLVNELRETHAKSPSAESLLALQRRSDTLQHVKNLTKGDPKARAEKAAAKARAYVRRLVAA